MVKHFVLLCLLAVLIGCAPVQSIPLFKASAPKAPAIEKTPEPECSAVWSSGYASDGYVTMYSCENGKLVRDFEGEKKMYDFYAKRQKLALDFSTRCLSDEEYTQAVSLGTQLYITPMVSYNENDLRQRFLIDLQTQQVLRRDCPR